MKRSLFIVLLVFAATLIGMAQNPVLQVTGGKIQGVESTKGVILYKGIPYAAPPTGDLRWKAPQDVIPWQGVRVADHFGPASLQGAHIYDPNRTVKEYGDVDYVKEFFMAGDPVFSEDCLYLNVWQPADAKKGDKLPVAFWIHGGSFMGGYGYETEFSGDEYAHRGVILVTINYRVGILGFLAHPELTAENPHHVSGNYGLLDEIKALEWVRDNIAEFGGDPNNITIFGQSAGAISVRCLVSSPVNKVKIAHAIIQSGGGLKVSEGPVQPLTLAQGEQIGLAMFPGKSLKEMRAMGISELTAAYYDFVKRFPSFIMFSPIIDNYAMINDLGPLMKKHAIMHIPYMLGVTLDDMDFSRMTPNIPNFSLELEKNGYKPAYLYEFMHRLPGDGAGAFHSAELWYMFGTLKNCWRPMTQADYNLSDEMITYWTNFMKNGNPNGKGVSQWNPYSKKNPFLKKFDAK